MIMNSQTVLTEVLTYLGTTEFPDALATLLI